MTDHRQEYAQLVGFVEACVDVRLTPEQQLRRLNILKAMIQDLSDQIEIEAAAAAERVPVSTSFTARLDTEGRWDQTEITRYSDGSCSVQTVNISDGAKGQEPDA